jgi:hypothetical protein
MSVVVNISFKPSVNPVESREAPNFKSGNLLANSDTFAKASVSN